MKEKYTVDEKTKYYDAKIELTITKLINTNNLFEQKYHADKLAWLINRKFKILLEEGSGSETAPSQSDANNNNKNDKS